MLKVRNAKKPTLRLSPQRRSRPQLEHQNLSSPVASGSVFLVTLFLAQSFPNYIAFIVGVRSNLTIALKFK